MSDYRSYQLQLRIGGRPVSLSAQVPEAPMTLAELLPMVRALAEMLTAAATAEAAQLGSKVRCGPGCGACCRQLVPIAAAEAAALRGVIAAMEPARREQVLARFAAAGERLKAAGLDDALRGETSAADPADPAARRRLGLAYFALGIPCPFLEQESCSIHPERPLACREYLVSSDPAHCARPEAGQVAMVEMPRRASAMLFRLATELAEEARAAASPAEAPPVARRGWLPLVLALEDAAVDAAQAPAARPGTELFERLLALLAGAPLAEG